MTVKGSVNPLFIGAAASGGYSISRSLRFNSADSAYLSRTPSQSGNRKTWTWAGWVKRSALSYGIFEAGTTNNITALNFDTNSLSIQDFQIGVVNWTWTTPAVFRDFSAWYHIVVSYDTTQSSSANTVKIYVNGIEQSLTFATNGSGAYSQNRDSYVNSTSAHRLGTYNGVSNFADMYLADIHFIDGQALTPSSFGEFDRNGIWQPKAYSGTYGTNGFQLKFADNSNNTATTLGKDTSPNGNNWTPNNLSVTAGAGNDSLVDVPINGTQIDTGIGGQVRGNYCTLNPLNLAGGALLNGNLDLTNTAGGRKVGTIGVNSGKWYWEVSITSIGDAMVGIMPPSNPANTASSNFIGGTSTEYGYYGPNGQKYNNGSGTSYGSTFTNGDIIGVALDLDSGTLTFYKNGVSQGTAFSSLSGTFSPGVSAGGSSGASMTANFGQRSFAYTAPSGFKALCTANLPAPTITNPSTVFDVELYTGNGGTQTISGLGFSPDLVWLKARNNAFVHGLFDTVRGASRFLISNSTSAELVNEVDGYLSAFTSDGFTLSPGSNSSNTFNSNSGTQVAWTWDAGSTTVTNTQGSITSQVRANPSAGFSIVTFTATGNSGSIGHGLGVSPSMIIIKSRNNPSDWVVYHVSIGADKYLNMNKTDAAITNTSTWQNTSPTSTVFYSNGPFTTGWTEVAYCFAPVAGYSAFGSFTGNGSATDGPFVFTGFRPRWLMIKRSSDISNWTILDTTRRPFNVNNTYLDANVPDSELSNFNFADLLSNGFKIRAGNATWNVNNNTYIYVAFAENPFSTARAR